MRKVNYIIILGMFILASCNQAKKKNSDVKKAVTMAEIDKEQLVAMLDTIWRTEQEPITVRDSLGKVHGYESEQFKKQNEIYHKQHNINEMKVLELLEAQGWPDKIIVGEQGHLTICNVLQHSGIEVRKKYIPIMKMAVKEKGLAPRLLARSEDRLATDRGKLQIYGGQIKYYPETKTFNVWPILDPENVDKKRADIGLPPMAEFLSNLRNPLKWDIEEQMRRTNEFELERSKKKE